MPVEREDAISPEESEEARAFWRGFPAIRREANVTQRVIAERLGTAQSTVSLIESEGMPSGSNRRLVRYMEALTGWAEPLPRVPLAPTRFEQHAKQLERTPDLPGGDIFVAHIEDTQLKIPESMDQDWSDHLQQDRDDLIRQLLDLYRTEIRLPLIAKHEQSPEEVAKLRAWIDALSNNELIQAISICEEDLDEEIHNQWPEGLATS